MGIGRISMKVLIFLLCAAAVSAGRHHEQNTVDTPAHAGKSDNPLINDGETPSAAPPEAPQPTGQATNDLKKADPKMAEVAQDAKKISEDTKKLEDGLWHKMKNTGSPSELGDAASALKTDADNLDMYSLEQSAKKDASKAVKDSSASFGLGESNDGVESAAEQAVAEQKTAMKQTVEMANAYNSVKADAGDLSTLKLEGVSVESMPSDIKKDVALLNQLRLDAASVAKGEQAAVETDQANEV